MLSRLLERAAAGSSPDAAGARGIGYVRTDGSVLFRTYAELLEESARVLQGLRDAGLHAGDKLILACSRNEDFVPAFWGCVLGGIVPVPLPPPAQVFKPGPAAERLDKVWRLLDKPHLLLDGGESREAMRLATGLPADRILHADTIAAASPASSFHAARAADTAFIQFSSGSTGSPRGIVLTQAAVVANATAIADAVMKVRPEPEDSSVNWMPLYHDMGLIGFHLTPMATGHNHFLIPTASFIRRPLLWLDTLEAHRGVVTGCPNFGYNLVLNRLQDRTHDWDLSRVQVIMNGAEPISVDVMDRFAAALAPFGLRRNALAPVYGLGENTLAVAFTPFGEGAVVETLDRFELQVNGRAAEAQDAGVRFASEGYPLGDCQIRIVDAGDHPLDDGVIGEIQVKSASLMSGYYGDEEASQAAFCGEWLRTGDLGFLRGGRLCVTGRAKDILFFNGQNFYSHDVEQIAQQGAPVLGGKIAVCGTHDTEAGREKLLLFLASSHPQGDVDLFLAAKRQLQTSLGLTPDVMIPLPSSEFPRTTSGKLQRYQLRQAYEQGRYDARIAELSQWIALADAVACANKVMPRTETERALQALWCEELGLRADAVGIHDKLDEMGVKSLNAALMLARVENQLGVRLHSSQLGEYRTIAEMAAFIDRYSAALRRQTTRYFRG